ncbi:MAG: hypothetical protein ACRDPD_35325, partial [Streptosporangiaceae bacterium]
VGWPWSGWPAAVGLALVGVALVGPAPVSPALGGRRGRAGAGRPPRSGWPPRWSAWRSSGRSAVELALIELGAVLGPAEITD